ncbi:MAG: hypothetical protein ACO1SV_01870 [Fimbriimonas sp.]
MTALIAVVLAQGSPAGLIESVRLIRLDRETAYRLAIQAKGTSPYVRDFHSYDPPNVYTLNDTRTGPAVLLHGFDPQADFLTVFAFREGRWRVSETIYARYGITFTHGRQGQISIEAKTPREIERGAKGPPMGKVLRYRIEQGALVEAGSGRPR